ncbi:MAG: hypothetical protein JNK15_21475 [Planctomycetes bacterium]|nr:hypothetical protein [Planctomycetota bacterium]
MHRFTAYLLSAVLAFALRPALAQDAFAKEEAELAKQCVSTLSNFANVAKSNKVGQRAKQAYDLCLQYDVNQSQARSELGYKKEKDQWVELPAEKKKKWFDKATYEGRWKVMDEWAKTALKLGELHRKFGLKLKEAGNATRAAWHFEKAIYYNAMDKEANLALGYKEGPGFYGTDTQIAFANKMKEIETYAVTLAKKPYEVKVLSEDKMPAELVAFRDAAPDWMKKPNFDIHGAQSAHFTVWVRGTQKNADDAVQWGERALDFGIHLLGAENAKRLRFVERASEAFQVRIFVWTPREREEFLKANPHVWEKSAKSMAEALRYRNNNWQSKEGSAIVQAMLAPVQIHDSMIGTSFQYGLAYGRNEGLGEGLLHAATWYLQYTCVTRYGADPEGSVTDRELKLPDQTNWWLRAVRDQAMSNQDWALDQVPRERLSRFRNDCRLKSWSFMTWVVAAYPDKWLGYFLDLPDPQKKMLQLEEINEIGKKHFGKSLQEVEAEWREWARGDSGVAAGTGYGPPLLPERPNKEELAVLDRLNAVRGTPLAFSWGEGQQPTDGKFAGLPVTELDAEASLACEDHARFLTKHPAEHLKWPEAHEENPALEGFSPRGQRAAMGSVIIHRAGQAGVDFARDSIDGWLGTPYHRFPLLEHNIKRFGYSFLYENEISVAVLDMASLEEPYDPAAAPKFICWPPHGMKDVPTDFHGIEHPNPLEDQPEAEQDITKTGYPISMQMQAEFAGQVGDSTIQLYEARSSGKLPASHVARANTEEWKAWTDRAKKEVPMWVHTPQIPLNRKVEIRDVVFGIPKDHLEPGKHYQVRVKLQLGQNDPFWFFWEFTCGTQGEGLRLKS